MINESKRIEFWNFLTTEKNQPRPKGITVQRLAVIKSDLISSDEIWRVVIELPGVGDRGAAEFYRSHEPASVSSRMEFWNAVRSHIRLAKSKSDGRNRPSETNDKPLRKFVTRKRFR
jgi:hypothetical protein